MLTCSEMKKSNPDLFHFNVFFNGAPTEILTKSIKLGRTFGFSSEIHSKFLSANLYLQQSHLCELCVSSKSR